LIWLFHMALPLVGLWLLLGNPGIDLTWQDHVAHFWIVLATALIGVALAILVAVGAQRHDDARLYLVALGFTAAAAFLATHAFLTPDVVVDDRSAAFNLATPIGVAMAGLFALAASLDMTPDRAATVLRWRGRLAVSVALALVVWTVASLVPASPLGSMSIESVRQALSWIAIIGLAFYAVATIRSIQRYRRQRASLVLASVITAQVLLAESLVAMALAPNWHVSWWLWHILMVLAFAYIAYAAQLEYRREGTTSTLFTSMVSADTLERMREDYAAALDEFVVAIETAGTDGDPTGGPGAMRATVDRVRDRLGISDGQADVLEEAAETLAEERLEGRRLAALVAIGREARVVVDEDALVSDAQARLQAAFPGDVITITRADGAGGLPDASDDLALTAFRDRSIAMVDDDPIHRVAIPLQAAGPPIGVLRAESARGAFSGRALGLLESAANQLAVVIDNGRLYRQVERLFRSYLSPDVARTLLADPSQAGLGGKHTEATVLFADLRGFTPFSVGTDPADVVALLNRYFGAVVPLILAQGGTVVQFVGDEIMAIFNAPVAQPDHEYRAARAGLDLQAAVEDIARRQPDAPRFRVGIETGPVLLGNIGAAAVRTYTAIGETTNLAARLQAIAAEGSVVIGPTLAGRIEGARVRRLGPLGPSRRGRAAT
jgi:class 3 adenylate cyclase